MKNLKIDDLHVNCKGSSWLPYVLGTDGRSVLFEHIALHSLNMGELFTLGT